MRWMRLEDEKGSELWCGRFCELDVVWDVGADVEGVVSHVKFEIEGLKEALLAGNLSLSWRSPLAPTSLMSVDVSVVHCRSRTK